jgi:hypothetical protein
MAETATKCSAADGVTQTFDFCHGTPLMVRAVDFNALYAECQKLRNDAELLSWVLAHPETAAEELADAAAGDGTARENLERRMGRIGDA